jgi:hypothetical protein
VCGSRVLWKIFGPERDGVTGEWRRLQNVELNAVFRQGDQKDCAPDDYTTQKYFKQFRSFSMRT